MQASVLLDVFYNAGQVEFVAYYCSASNKKAWSLKVEINGECHNFPVQWGRRTDFEKRYGEASNAFWYTVAVDTQSFFNKVLNPEAKVSLLDESMDETAFPLGFLNNQTELQQRVLQFLTTAHAYALQSKELDRAMAYCLALQRFGPSALEDANAVTLRLWSQVALQAKREAWTLPSISSFEHLEALCQQHFGDNLPMLCAVLMRLSVAYDFEYPLLQRCEQRLSGVEADGVEYSLVLSVLYLKRMLPLALETFTEGFPNPSAQVSHLFKRTMLHAPQFSFVQMDMAEKMAVVCAVYHRVFHFKKGNNAVGFRDGELQNFARRLHLASFGTLPLSDLDAYQIK